MTGLAIAFLAFIGPPALLDLAERIVWALAPRHPHLYRLFEGDPE